MIQSLMLRVIFGGKVSLAQKNSLIIVKPKVKEKGEFLHETIL